MDSKTSGDFNQKIRERTQAMAARIYELLNNKRGQILARSPFQQLVRCSTSVAANFRSATRSRSQSEFYSKICIVTEECDETLYWIDFLIEVGVLTSSEISVIRSEAEELTRLFASIKHTMKQKLDQKK